MLAIFIGSCGIVLSVISVLLSTSQTHRHLKQQIINACYYFEGAYALCILALSLWLIVKQKHLIRKGHVQFSMNSAVTLSSQENVGRVNTRSSRVHIVVFGVGATLYIIFVIVNFALRNQVLCFDQ